MTFPKKPFVPKGVTYNPHAKQKAKNRDDEHERVHGPDFPQTAAARKSAVTEEDAAGPPVLDQGTAKESGPKLARSAAARPDRPPPEPDE